MAERPSIRILVTEDHPITRAGLIAVISQHPRLCLVGEAHDGHEAVNLYRLHKPDIVLMDMRMPQMDGLEATRAICAEFPSARIVVFSISDGDETIYQAIKAGAKAYLLKDAPLPLLLETIEAVFAGQTILPGQIAAKLTGRLLLRDLSAQEHEILEHIVAGKSNREIGSALFISEGTVKSHVNTILHKLQVTDRTQAAVTALQRGIVWEPRKDRSDTV